MNFHTRSGLLQGDTAISDRMKDILKPVTASTVNTATGSDKHIK